MNHGRAQRTRAADARDPLPARTRATDARIPLLGRTRAARVTLWVAQVLVGGFFIVAAAVPKIVGERYAVEMFDQIGPGAWFRLLVGFLELAGGVGLLIPRLSGLAALGLLAIMVGASYAQVFLLDAPAMVVTPASLGVLLALIAWGRWPQTRRLFGIG